MEHIIYATNQMNGKLGNMEQQNKVFRELAEQLKPLNPANVLVFGSSANGIFREDSDIDLLVILDNDEIMENYAAKIKRKKKVSKLLRSFRKKIPIDLLVYSKKEWELLQKSGSMFFQEISKTAIKLI